MVARSAFSYNLISRTPSKRTTALSFLRFFMTFSSWLSANFPSFKSRRTILLGAPPPLLRTMRLVGSAVTIRGVLMRVKVCFTSKVPFRKVPTGLNHRLCHLCKARKQSQRTSRVPSPSRSKGFHRRILYLSAPPRRCRRFYDGPFKGRKLFMPLVMRRMSSGIHLPPHKGGVTVWPLFSEGVTSRADSPYIW